MILSAGLLDRLQATVGAEDVLFKEPDLQLYSYDSGLDRAMPSAIAFPKTPEETAGLVKACVKHQIPYVARGAGTNLCGGTVPLKGAVVIAPTKMNKMLAVDFSCREGRQGKIYPRPLAFLKAFFGFLGFWWVGGFCFDTLPL